jgi:hypothetical protein
MKKLQQTVEEKDKNPIIGVKDGKISINGRTFELDELRESKEYLQTIGAEEAFFCPDNDEELDELHQIITRMGEISPDCLEGDNMSYFLN